MSCCTSRADRGGDSAVEAAPGENGLCGDGEAPCDIGEPCSAVKATPGSYEQGVSGLLGSSNSFRSRTFNASGAP